MRHRCGWFLRGDFIGLPRAQECISFRLIEHEFEIQHADVVAHFGIEGDETAPERRIVFLIDDTDALVATMQVPVITSGRRALPIPPSYKRRIDGIFSADKVGGFAGWKLAGAELRANATTQLIEREQRALKPCPTTKLPN